MTKISRDSIAFRLGRSGVASKMGRFASGIAGSYFAYPIAERMERRCVVPKLKELKRYYTLPLNERERIQREQLKSILDFSFNNVPYYRDIQKKTRFKTDWVLRCPESIGELPLLTKEDIREQGDRLEWHGLKRLFGNVICVGFL